MSKQSSYIYDPSNVASSEELKNRCDCIVHSNYRKIMHEPGYMEMWHGDEPASKVLERGGSNE